MSKKQKFSWLICVILFLHFLLCLFFPEIHTLQKAKRIEINVVKATEIQSYSMHSSLSYKMYKIESNDAVYHFSFPTFSKEYDIFRDNVENELLNGRIKTISAVVATRQVLWDRIRGQHRILAFSVNEIDYLSVEFTKKRLISTDMVMFLAFLFCGVLPLACVIFDFHLYGIITYQKKPKSRK